MNVVGCVPLSQNIKTELLPIVLSEQKPNHIIFNTSFDFSNIKPDTESAEYIEKGVQKLHLQNNKIPYLATVQTDISSVEMTNELKNYATVNTAEPISTQFSTYIGTENIENGKEGETLNNVEMELEENSIITEIENAGIDIYDINLNNRSDSLPSFDVDMFENSVFDGKEPPKAKSPNIKILDVQNIVPNQIISTPYQLGPDLIGLDKQIYMPEALEMSLACEEENPSTWIDAINLLNHQPVNVYEQPLNEVPLTAVPTAIPSFINIEQNFKTAENNVLKNLTADADICKCIDCKCDPFNNCHGCNQTTDDNNKMTSDGSNMTVDANLTAVEQMNSLTALRQQLKPLVADFSNQLIAGAELHKQSNTTGSCCSNKITQTSVSAQIPISDANFTVLNQQMSNLTANMSNMTAVAQQMSNLTTVDQQLNAALTNNQNVLVNSAFAANSNQQTSSGCCCDNKSGASCCGNTRNLVLNTCSEKPVQNQHSTDCTKKGDDCCVVVCLKTIDQLRQMLSFASSCGNFQNLTLGCIKNDLCSVEK